MSTFQRSKKTRRSFLKKNWQYLLIGLICSLYLLWAIPHWVFKPEEAGQFGDLFGAITALIGTFSVLLLIQSLRLQQRELNLARKEYRLGLEEMKKQNEIGAQQLETNKIIQETAEIQRIENTFFNMVNLYSRYVDDLAWGSAKGRGVFVEELKIVSTKYLRPNIRNEFHLDDLGSFREKYNRPRDRGEIEIGRYYSTVQNVLKFIFTCGASQSKKEFYLDTFISLMTVRELAINFVYIKLKMSEGKTKIKYDLDLFLRISGVYERVSFPVYGIVNIHDLKKVNCDV